MNDSKIDHVHVRMYVHILTYLSYYGMYIMAIYGLIVYGYLLFLVQKYTHIRTNTQQQQRSQQHRATYCKYVHVTLSLCYIILCSGNFQTLHHPVVSMAFLSEANDIIVTPSQQCRFESSVSSAEPLHTPNLPGMLLYT